MPGSGFDRQFRTMMISHHQDARASCTQSGVRRVAETVSDVLVSAT
jgi:uncharacterized protein (DUF305 family)